MSTFDDVLLLSLCAWAAEPLQLLWDCVFEILFKGVLMTCSGSPILQQSGAMDRKPSR